MRHYDGIFYSFTPQFKLFHMSFIIILLILPSQNPNSQTPKKTYTTQFSQLQKYSQSIELPQCHPTTGSISLPLLFIIL